MNPRERDVEEVVADWSPYEREEAARTLSAYIAILREWDQKSRMAEAERLLESASPEE